MERVDQFLHKMSLNEKVNLLIGQDFWHTHGVKRLGLAPIVVSDGPFGLRKVEQQSEGAVETSLPATAFPTTVALASTFNDALMAEVGQALAKECIEKGVDILLGPGINIKRNPLCGRNFEYFSEDPYLTGRLATVLVNAIQSKGIGCSLKHFAVNNQEEKRLIMNAIVDERALFEIYLRAFEMVIKEAKPWTVMCSYNQVNGLHASRNPVLLRDILRERWGFRGLVMSDWGAVVDLGDSLRAGLNLEMPGYSFSSRKVIADFFRRGIKVKQIDEAVRPLVALMIDKKEKVGKKDRSVNYGDHHNLAVKVASEAAVLLKNDNHILPLTPQNKIALIGAFAKHPRYQGSGSSRINPKLIESAFDAFSLHGVSFEYRDGYHLDGTHVDETIAQAVEIAKNKDAVILMVGLPDDYEMEGKDREHIDLPNSHVKLIESVASVNENVIVVLSAGSAVSMPWLNHVRAVLHMHLAGQGSGEALYQLVFGLVNPSGKLTETYPLKLEDVPSYSYFGAKKLNVEYRESIYVGYRYYQKAEKPVLFPFGYGLSYTTFTYKDIELSATSFNQTETITVSFTLKNTGKIDGAEVVQLYVGPRKQVIFQAPRILRNFKKVFLRGGEETTITFDLTKDDFAIYDVESHSFKTDSCTYKIYIGSSSEDIRLTRVVKVETDFELVDRSKDLPAYYDLKDESFDVPFDQFVELYGQRFKHYRPNTKRPYSANNCLNDTRPTKMGRFVIKKVTELIGDKTSGDENLEKAMLASFLDTPIRSFTAFSGGTITKRQIKGIVNILNLRLIKGLIRLIPKRK